MRMPDANDTPELSHRAIQARYYLTLKRHSPHNRKGPEGPFSCVDILKSCQFSGVIGMMLTRSSISPRQPRPVGRRVTVMIALTISR